MKNISAIESIILRSKEVLSLRLLLSSENNCLKLLKILPKVLPLQDRNISETNSIITSIKLRMEEIENDNMIILKPILDSYEIYPPKFTLSSEELKDGYVLYENKNEKYILPLNDYFGEKINYKKGEIKKIDNKTPDELSEELSIFNSQIENESKILRSLLYNYTYRLGKLLPKD